MAAEKAIACPLLEGANLQGARGLLVYVTASAETMSQGEVRQVMSIMKNFVSKDAQQIIGTAFDNTMGDELRVTVVATGLDQPLDVQAADVSKPNVFSHRDAVQSDIPTFGAQRPMMHPEPEPEPAPRPQPQRPRPQVPRFTQGFSTASVQPQPVAAPREDSDEGSQGGDAPQIINVPAFIRHGNK